MSARPKHPLAIRWFHWVNFPVITLMIWSGLLIYWSNDIFRIGFGRHTIFHFFPEGLYESLGWDHRLADGMAWHFSLAWIFALNGALYVAYLITSGEWRVLIPRKGSLRGAWNVFLHDLGLSRPTGRVAKVRESKFPKNEFPENKFNDAQKIAYTAVVLMGLGALLTGLSIYKPVQLEWLTNLLGGYEWARWEHFWLTLGFIGFFFVHVAQVIRAGWNGFQAMITGDEE